MLHTSCHCLNIRLQVEEAGSLTAEDEAALKALRQTAQEARTNDSKHAHVPVSVEQLRAGRIVSQDIVYSCLLLRELISAPSETSPTTTQCLNCKDFVLVAAPQDKSIILLNHDALVTGTEAIKALESSQQYSPPFSLVLRPDTTDTAQQEDLSRIASEDPSRHPFDETTLPFEIRAALQDAIAALRQQADLLAAKSRAINSHYAPQDSSDGNVKGPDEFGLPVHYAQRDSSSESLAESSTPDLQSSDTDEDSTSAAEGLRKARSQDKEEQEVTGPEVLERLASPRRRKQRNVPGPSLLRNTSNSSSANQTASSSTSKPSSQRISDQLSGPGGDTVASAEKRVKFADEPEPGAAAAPSPASREEGPPRSMMRGELERAQAEDEGESDGPSDSDSDDPFPMDDDLSIPDETPKLTTSHPAQDEQESKMYPAMDAPASSPSPKPSTSTDATAKYSRLAAQHADQVAKLRDLLGADAPSHREDDLQSFKSKRFGPSHHLGAKRRPIKSPAHELPEDPFDESDDEKRGSDEEEEEEEHSADVDMARSLPISIMHHGGRASVKYDMKTSLPTHEGLLVPHFERQRKQAAAGETHSAGTSKTEERAISQQLRQATQNAVSASLSRSMLDERHATPPSEPSPHAAAAFKPQRRSNLSMSVGPSSLSQSIPPEMLRRLEQDDEKDHHALGAIRGTQDDQDDTADTVKMPEDEMEFEGDEPKRFLPPHLWVRMSRSGEGMLSSSVRDLHLEE